MTRDEFDLLRSITQSRYLAQIKGRTIEARMILPTVPAIVSPSPHQFIRDEQISPIEPIHPADIYLLPIRMNFQEYMRSIGF